MMDKTVSKNKRYHLLKTQFVSIITNSNFSLKERVSIKKGISSNFRRLEKNFTFVVQCSFMSNIFDHSRKVRNQTRERKKYICPLKFFTLEVQIKS